MLVVIYIDIMITGHSTSYVC